MNSEVNWIASRELLLRKSSGEQMSITLRIGQPYAAASGGWRCPVAIEGLVPNLSDIAGTDSWQAIQLAQGLQAKLLASLIKDGENLFYINPPASPVLVTLSELFQRFTQD